MNAQNPFRFISDPGHGWLEVPVNVLAKLGLDRTDFSRYSYKSRDGAFVYLEEDCDAAKFDLAWRSKYGERAPYIEVYQEKTPIRDYPAIHNLA